MYSQTQLANINTLAAIVVMVLAQIGVQMTADKVAFVLGAIWAIGSVSYNYYQRWQRGDITLAGFRK